MISSSPDTHPLPVARFFATCILLYNPQMNECNERWTDHFAASATILLTIIIIPSDDNGVCSVVPISMAKGDWNF